jgi:hypothetical protein
MDSEGDSIMPCAVKFNFKTSEEGVRSQFLDLLFCETRCEQLGQKLSGPRLKSFKEFSHLGRTCKRCGEFIAQGTSGFENFENV